MDDEIVRLVNDLARPIFNYRMATGLIGTSTAITDGQILGAIKRLSKAQNEIHQAVWDYAHRTGLI